MTTNEAAAQAQRERVMECMIVSHTHWDREWYRTLQAFRARLVDTIDRVLELLDADPRWRFVLDGQAVVLEDYVQIRPDRRADLERACRAGRLGIGPWYVQPDSLLPSGESHVRNLLEGRRVGEGFGPVSRVAYTPDSFGHPAQFPQLFTGFGLSTFIYWRGNGNEIDALPSTYDWIGPDGTSMRACHLGVGYFGAAFLSEDVELAVERLQRIVRRLGRSGEQRVLLMNGCDHAPPDPHTGAVADALAAASGWSVRMGLFDDFVDALDLDDLDRDPARSSDREHHGELVGGRIANLLPGVWSSRLGLKLRDRATEAALVGWAEPWAALGRWVGAPDEQPAVRVAWRELLANQAHDSIGGCSADAVHEQMAARYDYAVELADQTTDRVLERIAGMPTDRRMPWSDELDLAVFNPSPFPRTDRVAVTLDGYPTFRITESSADIHPLAMAGLLREGFTVDGRPARIVPSDDPGRFRMIPEQQPFDLEFVVEDVPAFGWRRVHVAPAGAALDEVDAGSDIEVDDGAVRVSASTEDGTFRVNIDGTEWSGLAGVEDVGDRGDTYDFDPVPADAAITGPEEVEICRRRHASGIAELMVTRVFMLPVALSDDRSERSGETRPVTLVTTARVVPGVRRVDLDVRLDNTVADHRLRLAFRTAPASGPRTEQFSAATTFDTVTRSVAPVDDAGWVHPAPRTFVHQGWVSVGQLTVGAPGLPEAEVREDGTLLMTLVRSVGWLARVDLTSRPVPAGPGLATPGAQCLGPLRARLSVFAGPPDPSAVRAAELGLRAVPAGPVPLAGPDASLLSLDGEGLVLSAVKPAERGGGLVVRVLNPTDQQVTAVLRTQLPVSEVTSVRLDEEPDGLALTTDLPAVAFDVRPHGLRSLLLA